MSTSSPTTAKIPSSRVSAEPPRLLWRLSHWITLCIVLVAIIAFFLAASEDWLTIINFTLIDAIAVLSLNVLSGYTGQVSLGIAFFMAIGAYTSAFFGGTPPTSPGDPFGLGLSVFIWLPAAGIVAALVGALIGPTALRLKGFYLGIVTLSLVFIGHYIFTNAVSLT
ncbi:MAG TPA: branched-chain amino acid ABC transporter permease, partial [Ktedonobacteraceae bacterium]